MGFMELIICLWSVLGGEKQLEDQKSPEIHHARPPDASY